MANLWRLALDDSDDGERARFLLGASLFGNKAAWNDFNKAWRACLHANPRIEHFRQEELTALTGRARYRSKRQEISR